MKNNNELTRRSFLLSAAALSGTSMLRLSATSLAVISQAACSARESNSPFQVLSEAEADDISAIAARIIPTTDTPGASEAGVVHFFDRALAAEMGDRLDDIRGGIEMLNRSVADVQRFAALSPQEQDNTLREIEGTSVFELFRQMTIFGFFAMSEYGGNKNHVGWEVIGFKGHNGAWEYPFGYYDAQVHGSADDGE